MHMQETIQNAKKAAGEKAADWIRPGMRVGLGTGSTAYWTIRAIGSRVRDGLDIKAVATSLESEALAAEEGIPLITFGEIDYLDLDIDGADEVDEQLRLIKGGGGALLREKIVASASRRMIVVADEQKLVSTLGRFPLPVEIIPFGWEITFGKLKALSCTPTLRLRDGKAFVTDNGNFIADCSFGAISDPADLNRRLNAMPGVVENGLFIDLADTAVIGYKNGETKILGRN